MVELVLQAIYHNHIKLSLYILKFIFELLLKINLLKTFLHVPIHINFSIDFLSVLINALRVI